MKKRHIYVPLQEIQARQDKETRAKSIQGRMRLGDVFFQKENDWYDEFFDELHKFPRARNDDYTDAFAHIGTILDQMVTPLSAEESGEGRLLG